MASKYNVVFKGLGAVASTESGSTILDSALSAGIALRAPCGGGGTCGKCAVRVVDGDIPPSSECGQFFSDEELNRGWRLACRCEITCDATIEVPQETLLEQDVLALTATGGDGARSASEPFAKRRVIGIGDLEKEDWKAPLERLDIPDEDGSPDWKKALDDAAKKGDNDISVMVAGRKVVSISRQSRNPVYVVAVDLGTTTIAASLLDAGSGKRLASGGRLNPQTVFGDDVLSRIQAQIDSEENKKRLSSLAVEACDELIRGFRADTGVDGKDIAAVVVAGNTVMQTLMLGLSAEQLGVIPFTPPISGPATFRASELGFASVADHAVVAVFPVISGYVGGDISAGLLSTEFLSRKKGAALFIDIGTNGEIVLSIDGKLTAAAAAAGPAFEGARIERGMRAASGAIGSVRVEDGDFKLEIIGGGIPAGICGSGLIDAVATALKYGLLEPSGRIIPASEAGDIPSKLKRRLVTTNDGITDILLADTDEGSIFLRQKDVREFQLASGAIRAAIAILMTQAGLSSEDLDGIIVAGGFGNSMNTNNAIRIGLLPDAPASKIRFAGNTSLLGAEKAAVDIAAWDYAAEIAQNVEAVDISLDPEFQMEFADAMIFPEMELAEEVL